MSPTFFMLAATEPTVTNATYGIVGGLVALLINHAFGYINHRSRANDEAWRKQFDAQAVINRAHLDAMERANAESKAEANARIDGLLKDSGKQSLRIEQLVTDLGEMKGKFTEIEKHRAELLIRNEALTDEVTALKVECSGKDEKIEALTKTNTELYQDLELVQRREKALNERVVALTKPSPDGLVAP